MNCSVTARGPLPGFISLSFSSAHGVNGDATCPGPEIPALPASQIPLRSRRGAGVAEEGSLKADWGNPGLSHVCASDRPGNEIRVAIEATIETMKCLRMSMSSDRSVIVPAAGREHRHRLHPTPASGHWAE